MEILRSFFSGKSSRIARVFTAHFKQGRVVQTFLFATVMAAVASLVLSGCGSIANSMQKAAARDSVLSEELEDYTYEASADEVWSQTKKHFLKNDFDLDEDDDISYFFQTDYKQEDSNIRAKRIRYDVEGTETDSGFQLTVTEVRQEYDSSDGEWEKEGVYGGEYRDYSKEFKLVKQIEPERAKKIQAKVDKAEKQAVSEEA